MQLANKVLRRAVPTAADSDDEAAVKERLKALIAARSQ
jgi:hypothetical protein